MSSGLTRGCVFGATHDPSYDFWDVSQPAKWKLCVVFNVEEPAADDDQVHYFIATHSGVNYFRENPHLQSDVLILPANAYSCFPKETAIDFRNLRSVSLKKLRQKGMKILDHLSTDDIQRCVKVAGAAMQLENRDKKMLLLR